MRKVLLIAQFLVITFCALAQDKFLSIDDAIVKNRTTLAPENLTQLQFVYGTDDYVYLKRTGNQYVWMRGNFNSATEQVFLSLSLLNQKLKSAGRDTLSTLPSMQFNKSAAWIIMIDSNKIAFNPVTNKATTIIDKANLKKENVEESIAGYVAYLDNFNLYISYGNEKKQVTTDGSKDIVYASSVHREEFGILKGTFWSNNGKQLAFYRMDQSMVTDYPIIDWSKRPAKSENIKYPMAGDKSHHVTVGVYNTQTKSVAWLNTGEPAEQYLTNIAWSPDDKYVYIAVLNRGQNDMKLNQYDAASGNFIKTLFEEKDDKYVEPLVPVLFVKNDPGKFIWQSNRDGWNHLYLYDTNGTMLKQLTKGNWEVISVQGFDASGENLFYVSTGESPITRNLYEVNIKTGLSKRITPVTAVHNTQVGNSGNFVIDNYSNPDDPRTVQMIETGSGKTKKLLQAANPLSGFTLASSSIFTIQSKNGDPLYCSMYKPANFDSAKKYPVIVYWYGGPHAQLVTNSWNSGSGDYWFQYMAEHGYVVFCMDTRGSDNRGKVFEQSQFRKFGDVQMEDMMSGVNYLKALPYVDQKNMGCYNYLSQNHRYYQPVYCARQ